MYARLSGVQEIDGRPVPIASSGVHNAPRALTEQTAIVVGDPLCLDLTDTRGEGGIEIEQRLERKLNHVPVVEAMV